MAEAKEGLWMSAKERERLKVLHEVQKRHITQKQAAVELRLSVRWVRELLVRWRAHGDGAMRHGLRERDCCPIMRSRPPSVALNSSVTDSGLLIKGKVHRHKHQLRDFFNRHA